MRKQNFRNLLRSTMQEVELPVRNEHLQKTISLAKNEWKERVVRPRITFSKFLAAQIKFVGWKIWLAQAIVVLCLSFLLVYLGDYILNNPRNGALLLCCISILVLMSAFPFIQRSVRYKMYEIETATRFSATKQLLAKLLIIGIGDISMLCSIVCVAIINTPLETKSILLYLLLPFLIASSGLLYLIGHTPIEKICIIFGIYNTRQNLSDSFSTDIFFQMGSNMRHSHFVLHLSDTIYPLSFFL